MYRKQNHQLVNVLREQLQSGQILLIVILVIIIALTIGLSLTSRSITSLKSSTEEAESQKALAAAEAGIERAIQGKVIPIGIAILSGDLINNSQYTVNVQQSDSSSILINGGNVISKDEGADIWVVGHDSNNNPVYSGATALPNANVYWGSSSENCVTNPPAAMEIIVVSRNSSTDIKSYRYAYDYCSRGNNFTQAEKGNYLVAGNTFAYKTPSNNLAFGISNIVFMRVIPIYKNSVIGASSNTAFPVQGYKIISIGTSNQANRTLTVFKGYPQTYLPYLSYGLFVAN